MPQLPAHFIALSGEEEHETAACSCSLGVAHDAGNPALDLLCDAATPEMRSKQLPSRSLPDL